MAKGGFTLAEMIVALAIFSLLGTLLVGTLIAQMRLARAAAEHALANDAGRTAFAVLSGELRRALPVDIRALATDSLAIRSFRGSAVVCDAAGSVVTVRYRGDRMPDPSKDSVLLIHPAQQSAAVLLDSRPAAAGACARQDEQAVLRLTLGAGGATAGDAVALLVFESGHYYLSSRALRYRLGREGRQPLTPELFTHPGTGFAGFGDPGVKVQLNVGDRPALLRTVPFAPPPLR